MIYLSILRIILYIIYNTREEVSKHDLYHIWKTCYSTNLSMPIKEKQEKHNWKFKMITLKSKRGNIYLCTGELLFGKQFTDDRLEKIIYRAHEIHLNVVLQPNTNNQHQIYNSCDFIKLTVLY